MFTALYLSAISSFIYSFICSFHKYLLSADFVPSTALALEIHQGTQGKALPGRPHPSRAGRGMARGRTQPAGLLSTVARPWSREPRKAAATWGLYGCRFLLSDGWQLSGAVSRGMQSRQALSGPKICFFGLCLKKWVCEDLSLVLAGF